jgi:hypothetical protein
MRYSLVELPHMTTIVERLRLMYDTVRQFVSLEEAACVYQQDLVEKHPWFRVSGF